MALIEDAKEGRKDGGYTRLFGDEELGALISRLQGTVISMGTELEKVISQKAKQIIDLDSFLDGEYEDGVYLASKKSVKHSRLKSDKEPDFLIFEVGSRRHCYIVELKDGDNFDTKKAQGEKNLLINFQAHISNKIQFTSSIHVCFFNQDSRENVVSGFKNKITIDEALTGKELCELLNIDYNGIVKEREISQTKNFKYFLDAMVEIEDVRNYLKSNHNF